MKLYELPAHQEAGQRPKILGLEPNGDKDGWIEFDHIDGMYSYCRAYGGDGTYLGVAHLAAFTPLEEVEGGYRVAAETDR